MNRAVDQVLGKDLDQLMVANRRQPAGDGNGNREDEVLLIGGEAKLLKYSRSANLDAMPFS